jgi:hypothetical protein
MTDDDRRADLLRRALTLTADTASAVGELFADELDVSSPGASVRSHSDLVTELTARDELFEELAVDVDVVDVIGDRGYAQWTVTATLGEAAGSGGGAAASATVSGVTVATFAGDRIVRLQQHWDELGLLHALDALVAEPQGS